MPKLKKILLIIPGGISYAHRVGLGMGSKVNQYESWLVNVTTELWQGSVRNLSADGIIMNISTPDSLFLASSLSTHVVNYSGVCDIQTVPTIRLDDKQIGAMAADYWISIGLKNFALFGNTGTSFAKLRNDGYIQRLQEYGVSDSSVFSIKVEHFHRYHEGYDKYVSILRGLPKPVGVFAQDDRCGYYLSSVARDAGLAVPNEIAILGVDNDPLFCNLAKPSLSSIATPAFQVGATAVDILAALMEGEKLPSNPILLPPLGVVAKGTTDMLAIDDSDLVDAIRFIRNHPCDNITVEDVLSKVPLSRRLLEKKFQQHFRKSPGDEIRRVRTEKVKELLLNTDKTVTEIAHICNYRNVQYLSSSFKHITGHTPSEFRNQLQHGDQ